jgi:hypothetical protein
MKPVVFAFAPGSGLQTVESIIRAARSKTVCPACDMKKNFHHYNQPVMPIFHDMKYCPAHREMAAKKSLSQFQHVKWDSIA